MNTRIRRFGRGLAVGTGTLALGLSLTGCGGLFGGQAAEGDDEAADKTTEQTTEDSADKGDDAATEASDAADDSSDAADDSSDDSSSASDDSASSDDSSDSSSSDDSGSKSDVTKSDLKDAKGQYMDFLTSLGDKDAKKACGFAMDPSTKKPIDGAALKVCAKQIDDSGLMDQFTPEIVSVLDESMFDAKANDDGTITVSVDGESQTTMEQADDGKWYFRI